MKIQVHYTLFISKKFYTHKFFFIGIILLANSVLALDVSAEQDPEYLSDINIPVPKNITLSNSVFLDNNDNRWDAVKLSGEINNSWNLAADLDYWTLNEPQSVVSLPGNPSLESFTGYRGTVKAGIRATNRINFTGELGFYDWSDQDAGWIGSLSSIVIVGHGSLTFRLHRDQLLLLDSSYDALIEEIEYKALDGSLWTPLGSQSAFYGSVSIATLSDDNDRSSTYMSLTTQPWGTHKINVGVSLFAIGFNNPSVLYWSPELNGSLSLIADAAFSVNPSWELKVGGSIGQAFSKQDADLDFDSNSYSLLVVSEWAVNNYIIAIEGRENRSLSDSPYEARTFLLSLKRNF